MEVTSDINIKKLKRIRFAVFVFFFSHGLCFASWASRIPDIKDGLELNDAAWGTLLLMMPIGQLLGMAFAGFIISRFGSRRVLPLAITGYVVPFVLTSLAHNEYILIIYLILFGLFGNICNIAVNTQGITIENMYTKPIMASFHGGWSLAGLTGAATGLLMTTLNLVPLHHFLIIAAIIFIAILFNYKYLQADIIKEKEPETTEKKRVKSEKFLLLLGLVAFCGMAAEGTMLDWSGLYLKDVVKVPESLTPIGLTAYMITMMSGRFLIDKVTQKWGYRRVVQVGGILISTGFLLTVIYPHLIVTLIAFMIIGLGTAGIVPSVYSIAGKKTKISTSMALTIVSTISFLGFLVIPPIVGYISHATNMSVAYALIAISGICITLFASRIKAFKN